MSKMRKKESFEFWQSFADLAMGLMAMLALILLVMLEVQNGTNEALVKEQRRTEEQLAKVQQERQALEDERKRFAVELLELFEFTYGMVEQQDGAEQWITDVFREDDCRLLMTPSGALEMVGADGKPSAAGLYDSGATQLSQAGQAALESCRSNFTRLAYCLAPDSSDSVGPTTNLERRTLCLTGRGKHGTDEWLAERLRVGVEAIVLEGTTDRYPLPPGMTPSILGTRGNVPLDITSHSFVSNAYLGAERARQALGHLLGLVQAQAADDYDALPVLMSRVRLESSSFGRFQVGPPEWRDPGCEDSDVCDAARSLALRIRWKKAELRRPLEHIRGKVCALLNDNQSAFSRGLKSQGRDLLATRALFGCESAETLP
jgi:hypothetical protein